MPCCPTLRLLSIECWVCRYIVDPQSEGVLLPTRGTEANMHQSKYKISSHVQAFLKQFAQWRSERQFESAGPWRLLKNSNSKLEVQCNQSDMTGHSMFQAMYILAPDSAVASVSCAFPDPTSLVMGAAAAKAPSLSGATVPASSKSKAGKSKAGDKVMCTHCGDMFGKQGIRNHEAKCAQKEYGKGWDQHKPIGDDRYFNTDDFELFHNPDKGTKRTTFAKVPTPTVSLSAPAGDEPKTSEQLLAETIKELKALKKQNKKEAVEQQEALVPPSSDDRSSSNSSPEKKKKSQQKKKSAQNAAELRAKAKSAAAAAAAAAEAEAGKRKKKKKKKKHKKEKKNKKQDEDSSCNDDSGNSSDGSSDSPPSSSDDNGHRRRKKQRRKQMPSANPTDAVRKSHKRKNAPTTGGVLGWYLDSCTNQAIFEEREKANQRMYEMVHIYLRNW